MKRLIPGLVLALTLGAPALAVQPNFIVAGDGPWHFGQAVPTLDLVVDWGAKRGAPGTHWALVQCQADEGGGYGEYQPLDASGQQDGWQFGPTPSWSSGGASCFLSLVVFGDGVKRTIATDTFTVGP